MKQVRFRMGGFSSSVLLLLAWGGAGAQEARAATFVVNSTADAVDAAPGDGRCEATSGRRVCTLRAAIQESNALAAQSGGVGGPSVVFLRSGTYLLSLGGTDEDDAASGDLDINSALWLIGAGDANTIVDAGGLDRVFDIAPVTAIPNAREVTVRISRLTVSGGESPKGGGIRYAATLVLDRSVVSDNVAEGDGGGLVNLDTPTDDARLIARYSAISDNRSLSGSGGGISGDFSQALAIVRSRINNNSAGIFGGGVSVFAFEPPYFSEVTVADNSAGLIDTYTGGGLHTRCARITGSTITGNRTSGFGGGISNIDCAAEITNTTISGNAAGTVGGGIAHTGGITLTHVTLANNSASFTQSFDTGGGIFAGTGASPTVTNLRNTLIANNLPTDCGAFGTIVSEGNNLDSDDSCFLDQPGDLPASDPMLGPLNDNGGFTQTHALVEGSPAIDAALELVARDQRGVTRPRDGDGDRDAVSDIGAFERRRWPERASFCWTWPHCPHQW